MKMTIYIPDDLKSRMVKSERKSEVNWSAVACAAFAEKLNLLERDKTMDSVIERLRKEKQIFVAAMIDPFGRKLGREWAMKKATGDELERLEVVTVRLGGWPADADAATFHKLVRPSESSDRSTRLAFWKSAVGESYDLTTPPFIKGFATGAMEVWDEVKSKL